MRFYEDAEDRALRKIWEEQQAEREERIARDKEHEARCKADAEACYGDDGVFDWDAYQTLCDMDGYWD